MISFDIKNHRFNLRAAAIALRGDEVLLHKLQGDTFWSLPGGRVNAGESAEDAIVREMSEELSEAVECKRLLWVLENFFPFDGKQQHEVGLYFQVEFDPQSPLLQNSGPFRGMEGNKELTFAWFNRFMLQALDVRPTPIAKALAEQAISHLHLVCHE